MSANARTALCPMIHLQRVSRSFDHGATFAVREFELEIAAGELLVLVGESGCGKTTTLRMVNRLIEPTSGVVQLDGRNIAEVDPVQLRRSIGYVIQRVGLFPHLTVSENIQIVPSLLGWPLPEIAARVEELLHLVRLPPATFRGRRPADLSGGQQQRVGLARALAARPKIMLMDEPFGALDPITRAVLQDEYRRIHESLALTTVMVTHDVTEALLLADRIVVMRQGVALRVGRPEEILRDPGHDYVRDLIETPRRQSERLQHLAGMGA